MLKNITHGKCLLPQKTILPIITMLIMFFTLSCKHHHTKGQPHAATEPKYTPGLHLQAGAKYYFNIDNETASTFEVNDKPLESNNHVKAGLIYEVVKDTAGGFLVKMEYDRFDVAVKTGDNVREMNSEDGANSVDPVERMLAMMKGKFLLVTLNSKGKVTKVDGYKELTDEIMGGITTQNEQDRQQMRNQLSNTLGQDLIKNSAELGFGLMPDSTVYEGDSWTKNLTQISDVKMDIAGTYTLSSVDDNIADIDAHADINDNDSSVSMMGYNVAVNLAGKEDANYKADLSTGMLVSGTSGLSIKGTVEINGKEVPVGIKVKKKISVKRI